ncbi:NADH dehydrogenase (quinone) subunit D [Archangium primigenium]|uniref:NADH dehydrogenase (quinone) subunit D n=1 Tax=[Archangium] primigenium TaxID=2792470 RepID=UPI00195A2013|nr:NADH dehydrogenase (quinone) subunit D [Archangium primigenium]MBM7115142.1 NADH-quinone oxidoreductase subunit D [Archangium primigenium]
MADTHKPAVHPSPDVPNPDTDSYAQESELEAHLQAKPMYINMGPSHPATHGTVRLKLHLEGETISDADCEIGFLHRGFQKSCENVTWTQCLPYTDRLNYASPLMNNFGFLTAVEKLIGLEIPERAQYVRVIGSELHRIHDHLTCVAATSMELGGFAPFLFGMEARELINDRVAELTGARLTTSFGRVGGLNRDLPEGWIGKTLKSLDKIRELALECESLLSRNRIFVDRMKGTGVISADDALDWGWTGPCLRACGVDYDLRKARPYWVYDQLDFDVPIGEHGDNYDRYLMRIEEMKQSDRILRQALAKIPDGPIIVNDWRIALPPKPEVYGTIEGVISHFKLVMEGIQVPPGEVYDATESANGELGWYIVSDGGGRPYKVHVRAPGFPILSAMPAIVKGGLLADLIPTFDTINMIGGEVEQ